MQIYPILALDLYDFFFFGHCYLNPMPLIQCSNMKLLGSAAVDCLG